MGNRSWILPIKNETDLKKVKAWMCHERRKGSLDFAYMVCSALNEEGRKTKWPSFFLCASTDGSYGIDSLFSFGYRYEPYLLGEQPISEKTLDSETGWKAAHYSRLISLEEEDYYEAERPERLKARGIAVDSLEQYKALHAACVTVSETPESGKAYLVPTRIVWLGRPDSKEITAPVVFIEGMTNESIEMLSEVLGRQIRTLGWSAVHEAYPEHRRVESPAWRSLEYWFNGKDGRDQTPVFSGEGRPMVIPDGVA